MGTLISFTGVCILAFGGGDSGELKMIPILLLLLATLCYAMSNNDREIQTNGGIFHGFICFCFLICFITLSIIALTGTGFFSEFSFSKDNLMGLMFVSLLSVFGTGLAMMMNYRLLKVSSPFCFNGYFGNANRCNYLGNH